MTTDRERAISLGINPDDPCYEHSELDSSSQWCSWCRRHKVNRPRLLCDCQQAEAAIMRERGESAFPCMRCSEPFHKQGLCCDDCEARYYSEKAKPRRGGRRSSALYQDDGHGCVERVSIAERDTYPDRFR